MDTRRHTIFLVDDDLVNLSMGCDALAVVYNVFTADSGARLINMLTKRIPDLILLDIEMPIMNGYDTLKYLKEHEETKDIPVVFLTARSDSANELRGLTLGAVDYISKPFSIPLLLKRIEVHLLVESQRRELESQKSELLVFNHKLRELVDAQTKTIVDLQNAVMNTFADLIEYRDGITGGHIGRTQDYIRILIEAMRDHPLYGKAIEEWDTTLILLSAQLHDIGKIAIKDNILLKPDRLTREEYEIIKTHVAFGENVIDKIMGKTSDRAFLEQARIMVSTHHEKWDGSGYPAGLKGGSIPLQGRIMAIVDVYDALISDRPYKKAYRHEEAVRIIADGRGVQFDPDLVDIFLSNNENFKEVALTHNIIA